VMSAPEGSDLNLNVQPPAVILMAGLQGTGKTTSAAKLAHLLHSRQKKKVMLVSADVYRPAAIDQLRTLAKQSGALFCDSNPDEKPADIAACALDASRKQFADILIVDTAGRMQIDADMMAELSDLHRILMPTETLFVADALTGQDAAATAKAFDAALPLTGIVLTKADGDSRGGAALSVRAITGKPIKFMAIGETLDDLEAFHPDRIASRILGMGDVLSLIEDAEHKVDKKKATKLASKIKKGIGFDLEDFRDQIQQMNSLGGMASMLGKLPGAMGAAAAKSPMNDVAFAQMEVIINSMTQGERRYPATINGSRKKRIAAGSGTQIQDVNRLLKQHKQMQKTMKKLGKKGGMAKMTRGMDSMMQPGGGLPPR
ncbi:MAG: signal recognition particle protein, partial [Pseudomonadales bacterium]